MLLLGAADLIAALLLVRGFYNILVPNAVIFFFAAYLFIKALIFIADIGSWMDIIAGLLLVLSISNTIPVFLLLGFAALVGLKGAMSILGSVH